LHIYILQRRAAAAFLRKFNAEEIAGGVFSLLRGAEKSAGGSQELLGL
jgi:hypothetical protein